MLARDDDTEAEYERGKARSAAFVARTYYFILRSIVLAVLLTKRNALTDAYRDGDRAYVYWFAATAVGSAVIYTSLAFSDPGYLDGSTGAGSDSGDEAALLVAAEQGEAPSTSPSSAVPPTSRPIMSLSSSDEEDGGARAAADHRRRGAAGSGGNAAADVPLMPPQCFVDAGVLQYRRPRSCRRCGAARLLRSKHCRVCDRCVDAFDHHCNFVGACIGAGNHVRFWCFLVSETLAVTWAFSVAMTTFRETSGVESWFAENAAVIAVTLVLMVLAVAATGMLSFHTYLLLANVTTFEVIRARSLDYLAAVPSVVGNPFSRGVLGNAAERCCLYPRARWWPDKGGTMATIAGARRIDLHAAAKRAEAGPVETVWRNRHYTCIDC